MPQVSKVRSVNNARSKSSRMNCNVSPVPQVVNTDTSTACSTGSASSASEHHDVYESSIRYDEEGDDFKIFSTLETSFEDVNTGVANEEEIKPVNTDDVSSLDFFLSRTKTNNDNLCENFDSFCSVKDESKLFNEDDMPSPTDTTNITAPTCDATAETSMSQSYVESVATNQAVVNSCQPSCRNNNRGGSSDILDFKYSSSMSTEALPEASRKDQNKNHIENMVVIQSICKSRKQTRAMSPTNQSDHTGEISEAKTTVSSPGKFPLKERLRRKIFRKTRLPTNSLRVKTVTARHHRQHQASHAKSDIHLEQKTPYSIALPLKKSPLKIGVHRRRPVSQTNIDRYDLSTDEEYYDTQNKQSLMRFTRQARLGRRGQLPQQTKCYNRVKIHVYDLIASETVYPLPWGCHFPLGQCFSVVNTGLHMIGTGAYHVGVEVNGIEYAFGSNNIPGLSGVFTCIPKMSPGYEFRTTLDFGEQKTMRKCWICIPDPNFTNASFTDDVTEHPTASNRTPPPPDAPNSAPVSRQTSHSRHDKYLPKDEPSPELSSTSSDTDKYATPESTHPSNNNKDKQTRQCKPTETSTRDNQNSAFIPSVHREVESFIDGSIIMEQMAKEYLGKDYDLLRKNCCTFARDACLRLGVQKEDIPNWFLSLAESVVDVEDAVKNIDTNVRMSLRRTLSSRNSSVSGIRAIEDGRAEETEDSSREGFEMILNSTADSNVDVIKIVESETTTTTSTTTHPVQRQTKKEVEEDEFDDDNIEDPHIFCDPIAMRYTLSWTY